MVYNPKFPKEQGKSPLYNTVLSNLGKTCNLEMLLCLPQLKKILIVLLNPFFRAHCAFYNYITINKSPRPKKNWSMMPKKKSLHTCAINVKAIVVK